MGAAVQVAPGVQVGGGVITGSVGVVLGAGRGVWGGAGAVSWAWETVSWGAGAGAVGATIRGVSPNSQNA